MHIVYISREYPPALRMGGIASYVKEIAETMVQRGHKVTVIAASDDTSTESTETVNGVTVIRLKGGDFVIPQKESTLGGLRKFRTIYRFGSYRKRIKDALMNLQDVDIVEVAEYGAEGYCLHDCGIPVTVRLHTPSFLDRETAGVRKVQCSFQSILDHWISKKELTTMECSRYYSSCSKSLADWTRHNVAGFNAHIDVIYNPLNISNWPWREEQAYEENTILYAGTVAEVKGVGDLIKAVAMLRADNPSLRLTIAGKIGNYGQTLKQECIENRYDWCKFVGHITREQLQGLYRKSKVACFPSWWEAMGLVCTEAMATGNIVIGSQSGGMSEIITHGEDGYLVSPKNIDSIASAIQSALNMSKAEVSAMRLNAYRTIKEKFSGDIIASQLENHYKFVIGQYGKSIVG